MKRITVLLAEDHTIEVFGTIEHGKSVMPIIRLKTTLNYSPHNGQSKSSAPACENIGFPLF